MTKRIKAAPSPADVVESLSRNALVMFAVNIIQDAAPPERKRLVGFLESCDDIWRALHKKRARNRSLRSM